MTRRVLAELDERGLLPVQDKALPSVVGVITGEALRTSWWSHPKGRQIFAVLTELAEHPDVLFTKLLAGKDTLVHRRCWPSLLALATAREPWQVRGLSTAATRVLRQLDGSSEPIRAAGTVAKELRTKLLVSAREVHSAAGHHELDLESWRAWANRVKCRTARSIPAARKELEELAAKLGAPRSSLPWNARRTSK